MDTKKWIAVGVAALALVAEITLVFLNPVAAVFSGAGFVLGGLTGYFLKKKEIVTVEVPVEKIVEKIVYKKQANKKTSSKEN